MRINVTQEFKMLDGTTTLKGPDGALTLRDVIAEALSTGLQGDEALGMKKQRELYAFAKRITATDTEIDLATDEIVLIKGRIEKRYPAPLISGQAWDMIEGVAAAEGDPKSEPPAMSAN